MSRPAADKGVTHPALANSAITAATFPVRISAGKWSPSDSAIDRRRLHFSHQSQWGAFAAVLLRGVIAGLYSFVAFCFLSAMAHRIPSTSSPPGGDDVLEIVVGNTEAYGDAHVKIFDRDIGVADEAENNSCPQLFFRLSEKDFLPRACLRSASL